MEKDIKSITKRQNDVLRVASKVMTLETEMKSVKSVNETLIKDNKSLREKIIDLEAYSRRNNLILKNVPESPTPVRTILTDIIKKMGMTDVEKILIDDLHIGKVHQTNPHLEIYSSGLFSG